VSVIIIRPAPAPTASDFQAAIQAHVDAVAVSKLYNDGNAMASYANSTVEQWADEARAFIAWRDEVWTYAYGELDKVMAGLRGIPTLDEFVAELPSVEWPTPPPA
jgi:hypothetical protein